LGKVEPIRPIDPILGQADRRAELATLIERRNKARATLSEISVSLSAAKARKRETEARLREVRRTLSAAMKAYSDPEQEAPTERPSSSTRHMGGQSWDFRSRVDNDLVPETEMLVSLASLPPLNDLLQAESDALKVDFSATSSLATLEAGQVAASRAVARADADVEAVAREIIKPEIPRLHYEAMLIQQDLVRRRAILKQLVDLTTDRFRPKGDPLVEEAASYLRLTFLDDNHPAASIWREAFSCLLDDANTELPQ